MHLPHWFGLAMLAFAGWGIAAFLQKLSTNHISAESALIWLVGGFVLLQPWLYTGKSLFVFPERSMVFALSSGMLNALGLWAMLAAMKNGGKAAVVVPITSLYPLVIVFAAPILLRESITMLQGVGILCGLGAIILLST